MLSLQFRLLPSLQEHIEKSAPPHYQPGVPRVYRSFRALIDIASDTSTILSQARPLSVSRRHPYFGSEITPGMPVLIKMVAGAYGEILHLTLARFGYASTLYGFYKEEGLPSLYVFEQLPEDSWITLFDFEIQAGRTGCQPYLSDIRLSLNAILDRLEHEGLVHGDLRANNIMIHVKEGKPVVSPSAPKIGLKLIDFDWGGRAGQVRYPVHRNNNIKKIKWPAPIGEAIEIGHDRQLVDSWWKFFGNFRSLGQLNG
ncbi:hypothetical protein BDN70DRAFT_558408 [Pholiota conissans]|uniref:Uncharacterized protein n=1 Tax=Pholiota conissans TaxID=109636 RepID=A0A9P5Z4B3_9AGAR|nr:hypothetical protein BDN70DRAFT_558408 [Pholiota conissans]